MFQGNVAVPNLSEVDWDDDKDRVPDEVRKGFQRSGRSSRRRSLKMHLPRLNTL
jgi:hypothetical protein